MRAAPQPGFAVAGGLDAENPLVPVWIVDKADVFDSEIRLLPFPFRRPGEMRFVELLTKPGDFDLIRMRKQNLKHGDRASCAGDANRDLIQLAIDGGLGKATRYLLTA